ncbi:hypothetical protein AAFF_G00258860 [Aldrovandia affinis]|uniref:Uncharacterized protein n=1 Tax=Aldrovandia affinis TaxID=143900 RepID=A0AAD7SUK6_9TELE|nr:hypothetical protein AAFF_G00258860 [Aldrovandia affinis]
MVWSNSKVESRRGALCDSASGFPACNDEDVARRKRKASFGKKGTGFSVHLPSLVLEHSPWHGVGAASEQEAGPLKITWLEWWLRGGTGRGNTPQQQAAAYASPAGARQLDLVASQKRSPVAPALHQVSDEIIHGKRRESCHSRAQPSGVM